MFYLPRKFREKLRGEVLQGDPRQGPSACPRVMSCEFVQDAPKAEKSHSEKPFPKGDRENPERSFSEKTEDFRRFALSP